MSSTLPASFSSKKEQILTTLAVPEGQYQDLSPKGCVDDGIRDLIARINEIPGCVTTSSCAGRISIYLEGHKRSDFDTDMTTDTRASRRDKISSVGGKGGGGRWLFVSHEPVVIEEGKSCIEALGMLDCSCTSSPDAQDLFCKLGHSSSRLIHFKFEPMILHILTASLAQAHVVLSAAVQAGFRESGALNLLSSDSDPATPMVGIRSKGLALESIVGLEVSGQEVCIVDEWYLRGLLAQANQRFLDNARRIKRFQALLIEMVNKSDTKAWEDPETRRQRKRREGLERAKRIKDIGKSDVDDISEIGFLEMGQR
ncbi:hypothetical protein K3495_g1796 [Podosphaera aphanis]|nr:hypothetical protein K3495_g1796 [Podosphaera aphanis]